jgi:hypothetical protein
MKIFDKNGKINFVDRNNVLVGFGYDQSCCEHFGHFFSNDENLVYRGNGSPEENHQLNDVADYVFDKTYHAFSGDYGMRFRLVADGAPDLFLTVFNDHNGYYAHGLDMSDGDTVIFDTYL